MDDLEFLELTTQNASVLEDLEASQRLEQTISIVVPIFFSLIGITGFVGNLLVVITVLFNVQMRNTTNLLIFNLSFADLMFICFCIPFTAVDYSVSGQWPFGVTWCKCVQYLIIVTAYISIYTLVLMSFDRFLAVCYPVSRFRNERNTLISICFLWIVVLFINSPVFFAHGLVEYTDEGRNMTSCTFIGDEYFTWSVFHIAMFASSYLLPLVLISGLYLVMLTRLWKSSLSQSKESRRGKRRATRLVIIVVITFATLWLPIQTLLLLKSLDMFKADTHVTIALQISAVNEKTIDVEND